MAATNRERATSAFDILTAGLRPFVVQQMRGQQGYGWWPEAQQKYRLSISAKPENLDAQALLKIMGDNWKSVFAHALGPLAQGFVTELLVFRNRWAHQEPFSSADTARLLDTTERMLTAVSAVAQAAEIQRIGAELRRNTLSGTERGLAAEGIRRHTDKRVPRPHEVVAAVEVFKDDDPGFLGWRDSHPKGYVVNAYRNPTADYLMLHRTICPHLNRPVAEGRWTRGFLKACATHTDDLAAWARQTVTESARLKPCHWCKP